MIKGFKLLAGMKRLRGTPLDIFGYSKERKEERALIKEYESLVETLISTYDENDYDVAVEMARLPETARGFGHVKARNMVQMRVQQKELASRLKVNTGSQANAA